MDSTKSNSNDNDNDNDLNEKINNMSIDNHKRICLFCLKDVHGSLRCGKCMTALYCNRECQKKHWPVHKHRCMDSNGEDSDEKLYNKASNHMNQGNYLKAERMLNRLLARVRVSLGENHQLTLTVMDALANSYYMQNKNTDAAALLEECWKRRKLVCGENHRDTLEAMSSLADIYTSQGRINEAIILLKECLIRMKLVLGENNRSTLNCMVSLAICYDSQRKYTESEALYKNCLLYTSPSPRDS